jgi:hypothetical protein
VESARTNLFAPNLVTAYLCVAIAIPIFALDLDGYTLAETLMNYQFGFYRRALLGNFFIWPGNADEVMLLAKVAYICCLCAPLLIIARFSKALPSIYRIGFLLTMFFSTYGIFSYLKDFGSLRKELFFYPLFLLYLQVRPANLLFKLFLALVFIILCSLIHESFFFLFLPFFLSYLFLNKMLTERQTTMIAALSGLFLVGLSVAVKGNSMEITDRFVDQFTALGFDRIQFQYFRYYQKFSLKENLAMAMNHYSVVIVAIYNLFYLIQFPFFLWLGRHFGIHFTFNNAKGLVSALVLIWVAIFTLCFIAMDYGRWYSMGFVTSLFLVASQAQKPESAPHRTLRLTDYMLLSLLLILSVVLYIPFWTYEKTFNLETWTWQGTRDMYQFACQFIKRGYHHFFGS